MKRHILVFAIVTAVAGTVFAQSNPWDSQQGGQIPGNFAEHKAKTIARIEAHLACVKAAQSHDALRACNERHQRQR